MAHSCHIIVAGNPAIIFASRGGTPDKILPILERFLKKFWQERDTSGETSDTPECLVAQIIVRFGFEICEDDFSNLKVGIHYDPSVEYLYLISPERKITVWTPQAAYRSNPDLGLDGCQQINSEVVQ